MINLREVLKERSEIPKATACFRAERLGDCSIDSLTNCTFSGVLTVLGGAPCPSLLRVLPVSSGMRYPQFDSVSRRNGFGTWNAEVYTKSP